MNLNSDWDMALSMNANYQDEDWKNWNGEIWTNETKSC